MKKVILALSAVMVLSACGNNMKTKMGLVKQSPDEYMVISRAPLTLPPDYDLKPVSDMSQKQNYDKLQGYSAGEQSLLTKMNAQETPDDIREKVEEELKLLNE